METTMFTPEVEKIAEPLRASVARQKHERVALFAAAQERWPVLAQFADDTAAARFARDDKNDVATRAEVLRAFIDGWQRDQHPMWWSCIVTALEWLFTWLLRQFRDVGLPAKELMQLFYTSTFHVITKANVSNPEFRVLRWLPERIHEHVWKSELKREKRYRRSVVPLVTASDADGSPFEQAALVIYEDKVPAGPVLEPEREYVRSVCVIDVLGGAMRAPDVDLLCRGARATVEDEPHTGELADPEARERRYQAVKRRRTRLITKAQQALAATDLFEVFEHGAAIGWLGVG